MAVTAARSKAAGVALEDGAGNRAATLPRSHPSHEEDRLEIVRNANRIRELTESQEAGREAGWEVKEAVKLINREDEASVAVENIKEGEDADEADCVTKPGLGRTSSLEISLSKTLLLSSPGERTSVTIQPETLAPLEVGNIQK